MARFWNGFLNLLLQRIILVLALMFCVGVGIALFNMSQLSSNLIESQAVENAALYIESFNEAVNLYSEAAVDRAKPIQGINVTHAYHNLNGAIPLPSTFAIELGQTISDRDKDLFVRFYSDYPFPWRKDKGGARDDFERDALTYLRQNPRRPYVRFEKRNGAVYLRYGEPSIMQASCVACHNIHPDSPKKDWEVGDVGGVWEIGQPLNQLITKVKTNLRGTFLMLGGVSVLGLSGLTLVISTLRQKARELEGRAKENATDLTQANTDLEKRNQLIRQIFGRYLSDEVVVNLLDGSTQLKFGGDRCKVTILVADLRGFTALSEQLSPEQVIQVLNLYLEYMADVIDQYQGTIDEFVGDGVLVLFGAPAIRQDDALRAVACACAMQLAMGAVNEHMNLLGLPHLEMGIGIHTGEVVIGNIGSEKRTRYGIIGSPINVAYRIESYARGGQVLISEQTLQAAGASVRIRTQRQVQMKDIQHPVTVYNVDGISGLYNLYLPQEEEVFVNLPKPIALQFVVLDEQAIDQQVIQGRLVRLSALGAEVRVESAEGLQELSDFVNLKLNLVDSKATQTLSDDIYAKVTEVRLPSQTFIFHFTSIPAKLRTWLNTLYQARLPEEKR